MEKSERLTLVFSRQEIAARVASLAKEINAVYGAEPLVVVCVLKGAFMFFSDLTRLLDNPNMELDFARLASYGKSARSSGHVIFVKDIELDIRNKHVLVVEDIVDTGHSMFFLLEQFKARAPRSIKIASLLNKFERRETSVKVDFSGFDIPEGFLVGYGLDYAEHYRALPDIYKLEF